MSYLDDLQVRLSDLFLKAEEAGELSGLFPEVSDLLLKETKSSFRSGLELGRKQARRRKPSKAWQA